MKDVEQKINERTNKNKPKARKKTQPDFGSAIIYLIMSIGFTIELSRVHGSLLHLNINTF